MTPKAKNALASSIKKWEGIVVGTTEDKGPRNCALCKAFNGVADDDTQCRGCPVWQKTGKTGCSGTPYHRFRGLVDKRIEELPFAMVLAETPTERRAALAMLRFLEALQS